MPPPGCHVPPPRRLLLRLPRPLPPLPRRRLWRPVRPRSRRGGLTAPPLATAAHPRPGGPAGIAAGRPARTAQGGRFLSPHHRRAYVSTITTSAATPTGVDRPAIGGRKINSGPGGRAHALPSPSGAPIIYLKDRRTHTSYLVDTGAAVSLLPYSLPLYPPSCDLVQKKLHFGSHSFTQNFLQAKASQIIFGH
jgi:hypothetical protein